MRAPRRRFRRPDLYGRTPRPKAPPSTGPGGQAEQGLSETLIIVVSIFGLIGLGYATARIGLLAGGRRPADRIRVHAGDPAAPFRNAGDRRFPRRFAVADLGGLFHPLRDRVGAVAPDDHARLRARRAGRHRRRRLRRLSPTAC